MKALLATAIIPLAFSSLGCACCCLSHPPFSSMAASTPVAQDTSEEPASDDLPVNRLSDTPMLGLDPRSREVEQHLGFNR